MNRHLRCKAEQIKRDFRGIKSINSRTSIT